MKRHILTAMGLALGVAFGGCSSPRRSEPIAGALPARNNEIARGQALYNQHCHQCHPGGEGGLGPAINDKPAPVWLMKTQVRLGLGAMPSFGEDQISSGELDDLMAYVVARRKNR